MNDEQFQAVANRAGFIAALDQSGGSSPKALKLYGLGEDTFSNDEEMFDRIHEMRTRIITSPSFNGDRILGAILFEGTMDRDIEGTGSAQYLWDTKHVVPFLKVDKGLADDADGAQVMKPMPELDALCERAKAKGVFGTKMRSVIKLAEPRGCGRHRGPAVRRRPPDPRPRVDPDHRARGRHPQSGEGGGRGLCSTRRSWRRSDSLAADQHIMLKLTLPEQDDFYADLVAHPRVLKVVALSGGYSRDEANARLARNHGVIASFSRALTEGLTAQQSDEEFDAMLDATIQSIFDASMT